MSVKNKLGRSINTYGRVAVLVAMLVVAIAMAAQSVQINLFAQSDIDTKFSAAVAEQMSQSLRIRLEDTRRLQLVASEHPATLQALQTGGAQWIKDLRGFMPGSQEIQLVTPEKSQELHKSFGFAVQELVQKTLQGNETRLEALKKLDGQVRLYWATPIHDGQQQIVGVLLVEYGSKWLAQFQAVANYQLGQVTVIQYSDTEQQHGIEIFQAGHAERAGSRVTLQITNDWFLSYLPNDERPVLALLPLVTPWLVALVVVLILLSLLVWKQALDVRRNQWLLVNYLRDQSRSKEELPLPKFTFSLFYELAETMARFQRIVFRKETESDHEQD